jgi:hypothetical protein
VEPDLDDTVRAVPRPPEAARGVDVDDTVVRGRVPVPQIPPALVEPPAPERRPLPTVAPAVVESAEPVEPLEPTEPVEPAEPVAPKAGTPVYRARLANGTEIPIDAPVYVGRRPSIPRIHTGPAPRLVKMPSPAKEVSATHLELRVVGGALVASDMRSTNGTTLQLPGGTPRTLIRGESAVIVAGTRIDLGEGAVLDILPPQPDGDS